MLKRGLLPVLSPVEFDLAEGSVIGSLAGIGAFLKGYCLLQCMKICTASLGTYTGEEVAVTEFSGSCWRIPQVIPLAK